MWDFLVAMPAMKPSLLAKLGLGGVPHDCFCVLTAIMSDAAGTLVQ